MLFRGKNRAWGLSALLILIIAEVGAEAAHEASHRQMLALLQEIEAQTQEKNNYQGEGEARRWRTRLANLSEGAAPQARVETNFHLGVAELFLGNERRAIECLTAADQLIDKMRGAPAAVVNPLKFRLGVAYLRLGETENCRLQHTPESCILPIRGSGIHILPEGSQRALEYFEAVLRNVASESPLYFEALWLFNIAHMTLGQHPDGVPAEYLIPSQAFAAAEAFPRFANIAAQLGLDTVSLSGGAVADDFDGDRYLDLLVSTSDAAGQMRFFHNSGDGTFADRTTEAGLNGLRGGLNMVQADYDNDGDIDVLVLRGAWFGAEGQHPNSLLRNEGDGTFVDVTFAAGLGQEHYPTQTASWADYDNDGDVDVYIGNESTDEFFSPSQLFRNSGDGTFVDVAAAAGVINDQFTKAVVWGDYDNDRLPDLYVSNLGGPNRLYHNKGDGTFANLAGSVGVAGPLQSFSAWFWDYNNDGALDLFVASYAAGVDAVAASYLGRPFKVERTRMRLYRGDGHGGLMEVGKEHNLLHPTKPMGANFGDIDNDGYLDFYLGTGDTDYNYLMPNLFYRNSGGMGFVDVTTAGGFGQLQKGHSIAFADFDNDGDQDVFAQMGGAYLGDSYNDSLYENPGFGSRWLAVKAVGTRSNRAAIGVRLRVDIIEGGERRSVYKHVNSGGTFGANPLRQTIGLGQASQIERLEVYWPTTDATQVFTEVPLDAFIEVVEEREQFTVFQLPSFTFAKTSSSQGAHTH